MSEARSYPGFPMGDANEHMQTIPACVTMGLRQGATADGAMHGWIDTALPATRDADGRPARGAAFILADQVMAAGIFATLDRPVAMMTLDLRIDWFAAPPIVGQRLACTVESVVRSGPLALVRAMLAVDDITWAASTARFLIGAMPGGRDVGFDLTVDARGPSTAADFVAAMALKTMDDGWLIDPDPAMVGARAVPAYHGGFVAGVLDHIAASGIDPAYAPADCEVRYLAAARADAPLRIVRRTLKTGKRAQTVEVDAVQDGATVATARALFLRDATGAARTYLSGSAPG